MGEGVGVGVDMAPGTISTDQGPEEEIQSATVICLEYHINTPQLKKAFEV